MVHLSKTTGRFITLLEEAMGRLALVEVRYHDDPEPRLFGPQVIHHSPRSGNVNVIGIQYVNPSQPFDGHTIRSLTVDKIVTLRVTDTIFRPSGRIDTRYYGEHVVAALPAD
jgi:hypothetical protein